MSVAIDVASVRSAHPRRDEFIRSADFFGAVLYPGSRFRSQRAADCGDGDWTLPGDLTIKRIFRQVALTAASGGAVTFRA